MPKTQFNVEQFKTEAVKPLFAVAGATELAVELARGYATEAQKATQKRFDEVQTRVTDVQTRVQKVDFDTKSLQAQAKTRVEQLQADAKDAQAKFEARITELQKDAKDFPAKFEALLNDALEELNSTYAELQARGEKFVAAVRKDGIKAVAAVKPAKKRAAKNCCSARRSTMSNEAQSSGRVMTGQRKYFQAAPPRESKRNQHHPGLRGYLAISLVHRIQSPQKQLSTYPPALAGHAAANHNH